MSHYTTDYSHLDDEAKEQEAIKDIKRWFSNDERFNLINAELKESIKQGATVDDWRLPLAFAGVQGYPVDAWYNVLRRELEKENHGQL